jgi:hypothetical protein
MADDPKLVNAFSQEYLDAVREQDDPATALEAETAEPWEVREADGRYGLFHPWEDFRQGDAPPGLFYFRDTALLFRAVWPALGRDRLFRLRGTPTAEGYAVETPDQIVGHLRTFNPDAVFGAHIGSHLLRSPHALAVLMWLAGPTVQRTAGRVLGSLASGGSGEIPGILREG